MVVSRQSAIELLREYTKELDKMKFSKNGMDGTLRAPTDMNDEAKVGVQLERFGSSSKNGAQIENNWARKKEAEMVGDQVDACLEPDDGNQPDCVDADYLDFDRAPKVPDKNWLKELIIQPIEV